MTLVLFHGSSAEARRGRGQQSRAGRTAPNHITEAKVAGACGFMRLALSRLSSSRSSAYRRFAQFWRSEQGSRALPFPSDVEYLCSMTTSRLKQLGYRLEVLRKEKPEAFSLLAPGTNDGKEDRLRQFLMGQKASMQPLREPRDKVAVPRRTPRTRGRGSASFGSTNALIL